MSSFVYPGAQHTRFQHTVGAMYLMMEATYNLKRKGISITEDEEVAVIAAILLHDIGHGPFSHVLENTIIRGVSHEDISLKMMERMNSEFDGKLGLAISIFKDEYPKRFLHQLVSGNLDMDRLDYLRRDSFFTGVIEGDIGSARIIKMLNVKDDKLVVEAKGIYSVENYLMSRRLMYWQVYLHKTSLAAEKMLHNILKRGKYLLSNGVEVKSSRALNYFLSGKRTEKYMDDTSLDYFEQLDDFDIWSAIKEWQFHDDYVLSGLCRGLIERKLFKVEMSSDVDYADRFKTDLKKISDVYKISEEDAEYFLSLSNVSTNMYSEEDDSIDILYNDGRIKPITTASDMLNLELLSKEVKKQAYCHVRIS